MPRLLLLAAVVLVEAEAAGAEDVEAMVQRHRWIP
jgi:hypothetical protein